MKILLADDEQSTRKGIEIFLQKQGHNVTAVENGKLAYELILKEHFELIISDLQMPEIDGVELVKLLRNKKIETPLIIITAYASIESAVEAMKMGADDYLPKPLILDELKIKISKVENNLKLLNENKSLKEKLHKKELPEIVGTSQEIEEVKKMIQKVSREDNLPVMIYGKSGTGKELVAKSIHTISSRKDHPFVAVNCAALPDDLLESELFGHVKGAFTGAFNNKAGLFQSAHKGSLFLDEVGEMSPSMQAKLLRVLQDYEVKPLGSNSVFKVDVRIIGANNMHLEELVKRKLFREDLYYRINVAEINVPALIERLEDIPLLIDHFIKNSESEKSIHFTDDAMKTLMNYSWSGNIRELENFIKTTLVLSDSKFIDKNMLPEKFQLSESIKLEEWKSILSDNDFQKALKRSIENFERKYLKYYLDKNNGNVSKTAAAIKLSRVSLHKKISQYELEN